MPTAWSQEQATWSRRIDRAVELAERNPWANEILSFYSRILRFQRDLFEATRVGGSQSVDLPTTFRSRLDLHEAAERVPCLAAIVREHGPVKLAEQATRLRDLPDEAILPVLQQWLNDPDAPANGQTFFARVLLEPQAERLARSTAILHRTVAGNQCPICQSNPQMAVLRPEGDGGKRMLLCSLCHLEWEFRRVLCPACGEDNHEKLPRYSADGTPAVRVEACDTCKVYLKSVDLTVDGRAVPEVDEVATAPLDLWAAERDYHKLVLNLMGF